jgi:hypothetical protein
VKGGRKGSPRPPRAILRSTVGVKATHSTVPATGGPKHKKPPAGTAKLVRPPALLPKPPRQVARIVDEEESSLLDLIDNLLAKGVMLNADLILALANVDLVYVRLSALLSAADRVLPQLHGGESRPSSRRARR